MTVKSSFAEVNLDVEPGAQSPAVELDPDAPFRILLMGDFSGKGGSEWKAVEIDRDNFDEVMAKISPEFGGMKFREIDDFGPDAIYGQKAFQALRESVRSAPAAAPVAAPVAERAPLRPGMSLLDSMLEEAEPSPAVAPAPVKRAGMEAVVESIVAKYRVRAEDPSIARKQAESDAEASDCMRGILHDPRFQALEAAWRAVYGLVREVETSAQLRIYLLDVGKVELVTGLVDGRAERLLTDRERPWSVVAGNYTFGQSAQDAAVLAKVAKVMSQAGAAFLAEADPGNGGKEWNELRRMSESRWIGLAMPRLLLRLPYGKQTLKAERFDFEEMPGKPEHGHYLWGNPAFACVQLLAEAFEREGWQMRVGSNLEISGLPVHVYEGEAKPCAEVWLTERDLDFILDEGYIPLGSVRGSDAVRLVRFQSIAKPAGRLAGRWE